MLAGVYYLGVLCATYFLGRVVGALIGLVLPKLRSQARLAATHLATVTVFAAVILLVRSLDLHAVVPYLMAETAWWAVDAARGYRPSSRSRMVNPLRWPYTGRAIGALMTLALLGYCANVYNAFYSSLGFLGNVPVAASHADVLYANGRPALVRSTNGAPFAAGADILKSEGWLYASPPTRVDFDLVNDRSVLVECARPTQSDQGSCPSALTVSIGTPDWQVSNRLGEPTQVVAGVGTRLMRYPELGFDFLLEQYSVRAIRSYERNNHHFIRLWRLVRFSIP